MSQIFSFRTTDWYKNQSKDFTLPLWYYSQQEQITAAQTAVDAARGALTKAQEKLATVTQTTGADFAKVETDLAAAQAEYQVAKNLNDRVKNGKNIDEMTRRQLLLLQLDAELQKKGVDPKWVAVSKVSQDLRDDAQNIFDDANSNLKDAQNAYDDALTTDGAKDILKARAQVSIAEERYYTALDFVRVLQTGPEAQTVTAVQQALEQAQGIATQAQNAVKQAQANLDLLEAQIAKLTVTAPLDGIVLTRSVEPGEVLQAGMTALTIGKLDTLKVTVYIPENRYGEVKLGDTASLSVDSFPGVTFSATVTHIANQAEFTPRNIQTQAERQTTVYAVQLSVDNPDSKLKPGMPVDVTFGS